MLSKHHTSLKCFRLQSVGIGIILACVLPSAPTLPHTLAYSVAIAMTKDECIDFLRRCYLRLFTPQPGLLLNLAHMFIRQL